jgi:regulator of protease activity HflC (stomatin/prohibitin superfamily)
MSSALFWLIVPVAVIFFLAGIRIVRPTDRALVERLGKYNRLALPGFTWIVPIIERTIYVDITEQIRTCDSQEIITGDNLNAVVDLQIYYKVKDDEIAVKNSEYKVSNYDTLITNLARTTARNIIGGMPFKSVNSERNKINQALKEHLVQETSSWGIDIVRVELKDIQPPGDVQNAMNQVIVASQKKTAADDFATAVETEADGKRRAAIKEAEGSAQAIRLNADAQAKAIELIQHQLGKSEIYVDYLKAQRWDGKLPRVTGGGVPFLDLKGDDVK